MKSCSSWEEFSQISRTYACKCNTQYKITLSAYLSPWTDPAKPVPDEVFALSNSLEGILRSAFTGLKFAAVETPHASNPNKAENRYSCLYFGVGEGMTQMNCSLTVSHMRNPSSTKDKPVFYPCQPRFFMILPLNQYEQQSKAAIVSVWPLIEAFSHIETSPPVDYKYGAFGPQEIIVSENGNPIIIGHTAIQRLGLQLDPKEARNKDYVMKTKK